MPKEQSKKLDDKGVKCIFIGYNSESKSYRLYDPIDKKIIISRDVKFLEKISWNGSIDVSSRTSSKVSNIDEEEEDISDEKYGEANLNCRQR